MDMVTEAQCKKENIPLLMLQAYSLRKKLDDIMTATNTNTDLNNGSTALSNEELSQLAGLCNKGIHILDGRLQMLFSLL